MSLRPSVRPLASKLAAIATILAALAQPSPGVAAEEGQDEAFLRLASAVHGIVHHDESEFSGWPANHGIWTWEGGGEVLVGFTSGPFVEQSGHKIGQPQRDRLARSTDGGETWELLDPVGYAGSGAELAALEEPIDFLHPELVVRVMLADQARREPASFYYSLDRGSSWMGPHAFQGLESAAELEGLLLTPRTDYQVLSRDRALFFLSATPASWEDRVLVAETRDGGMGFEFASWVVGPDQPYRAVMPQTIASSDGGLLSLIRRRDRPNRDIETWIDAYHSDDEGRTWSWRSRVGYAGFGNSNGSPPAAIRLEDGRLLAAYANRSLKMMLCRLSDDDGLTWGPEMIIRDDFLAEVVGFADFGYPRLAQRPDGRILAVYYFATDATYEQHIAWSIFPLDDVEEVRIQRRINTAPSP